MRRKKKETFGGTEKVSGKKSENLLGTYIRIFNEKEELPGEELLLNIF